MSAPTLDESRSFLLHWDQWGDVGRYETQKHLRARIDGEEAAIFRAKVAQGELEIADKQIAFVAGERDAALAEVARLRALLGQRRDPAAVMERG